MLAHARRNRVASALALCAILAAGTLLAPAQAAITVPSYGTKVTTATTDFRPSLTQVTATALLARYDRGTVGDSSDDCYYIHFGAAADTNLAIGDYRIGGGDTTNCVAGVILTSSSTEIASNVAIVDFDNAGPLTAFDATLVKWAEFDAKPGVSDGDVLYVDLNSAASGCTGAAGTLGVCDLRLVTRGTAPATTFGTMVKSGEADLVAAGLVDGTLPDSTTITAVSGLELWSFDANQNLVLDSGDSLYLRITDNGPGTQVTTRFAGAVADNAGAFVPEAMDVRLTAYGGNAAGTVVASGATDHVPTLQAQPTAGIICVPSGASCTGSPSATDRFYVHWGTVPGAAAAGYVQLGDLALTSVGGSTGGTIAIATASGAGTAGLVSASTFASLLYYIDTNGNSRFDEQDGLYLHRPVDLGGTAAPVAMTTGDIRLKATTSGASTYAAGTVVGATDTDRASYGGAGVTAGIVPKFFDSDRTKGIMGLRTLVNAKITGGDATFATGEGAYVESTAAVATSSIRVSPVSLASGTVVASGNPDINTVGGALTALANVKIKDTSADNSFDAGECAYISTDGLVSTGDTRLTACGSFAAGTTVAAADADCTTCSTTPTSVIVAATNPMYITGPDTTYTAGTDMVYEDNDAVASTTVLANFIRVTTVTYTSGSTVSCTAPANIDCGAALTAFAAKVTGADGAWTSSTEMVYVPAGTGLAAGDLRVTPICASCTTQSASPFTLGTFLATASPSTVAAGDPDLPATNFGPGDALYVSLTPLVGSATASKIPLLNDVRLAHPTLTYGTSVGTATADFTPRYLQLALSSDAGKMERWDRNNVGAISDDSIFLRMTAVATATPVAGDARMSASIVQPAGTLVVNGDSDGTATVTADSGTLLTRLCFVNGPSSSAAGYDNNDFVYADTTGFTSATALLLQNALRVSSVAGAGTYAAGTIVAASDTDKTSYTSCGTAVGGGRAWYVKFLDQDFSGTYTAGGTDTQRLEHPMVSLDLGTCAGGTPCSTMMRLGDVPLSGSAVVGVTPPPPPGGGGGSSSTVTTTSTSTSSTTSTTTSTTSTTSETTTSTTDGVPGEGSSIATINAYLASHLTVTRDGANVVVSWPLMPGVAGYQVWRHNSPWILLATLDSGAGGYIDPSPPAGAVYTVTAYKDEAGKLTDINAQYVPGYTAIPTGTTAPDSTVGTTKAPGKIPGFEALALVAALGAAVVLVRRRLK